MSAGWTARSSLVFWGVAALFVMALQVLRVAAQGLLLTFAGVLFGAGLHGLAVAVARKLGWRVLPSLAACLALLMGLSVALGLWIVPSLAEQVTVLTDKLAQAYESLRQSASPSSQWSRFFSGSAQLAQDLGNVATRAAGVLASVVGALGAAVFVFFVALYVAASPELYEEGAVRLVPPTARERARALLSSLGSTLQRWLLGRLVSMSAVGLTTSLLLWLLGIPLPLTLGLIAGVLGFVPNFGPLVSGIPAVLMGFTISPLHALYVLILYLAINLADGYGLTPWLQKRAVSLPPALIIVSQVLMGALWGVLGLMLATPITACLLVLIRELYVKGRLESTRGAHES